MVRAHEFDGERCIHCGVNIYDCDHTDSECCVWRKPTVHTSETAPQDRHLAPEKRAALRAFADGLPAKKIETVWAEPNERHFDEACSDDCPGCTCHRNPPCTHCTDHVDYDE